MTFDAWKAAGLRLYEISSASAWWLGDWLVYGAQMYGKRYEETLRVAPLSYQTFATTRGLRGAFPHPAGGTS
jgi:hypothetical protein